MPTAFPWADFHEKTKHFKPSPLLVSALEMQDVRGRALDLGAGGLRDTKYLLDEDFEVTAVEASPSSLELARELEGAPLQFVCSRFEDFAFSKEEYELINAQYSLPFTHPWYFERVFERLYASLKPKGIFVGQFFGNRDSRCSDPRMTFLSWRDLFRVCGPLKIRQFEMREYDGEGATGESIRWHVFDVIACK